jgi:hypothetical protein
VVAVLSMSKQEFSRLDVLLRVQSGGLRLTDACVLIGLQRRQVFRLLRGLKKGLDGVVLSWVNYHDEMRQWITEVMPLIEQAGLRKPHRAH